MQNRSGSTEEHLTVTQFKVQREQERLDSLTAQADQKAQSLAKTSQTLSKKEKELAAVQKKATLTKEALIHARDLAHQLRSAPLYHYFIMYMYMNICMYNGAS